MYLTVIKYDLKFTGLIMLFKIILVPLRQLIKTMFYVVQLIRTMYIIGSGRYLLGSIWDHKNPTISQYKLLRTKLKNQGWEFAL